MDFNTLLFVGSGAIENGWKPISTLCKDIVSGKTQGFVDYGKQNKFFFNDPHDHFLTAIAFLETVTRSRMARNLEQPTFLQSDTWKMYSNAISVREEMAELFRNETSLSLRALDYAKYGIDIEKAIVVTSNWDNCVWAEKLFQNVVYLHGHCATKNSLVLPTQFITDEYALKYWLDLRLNCMDNNQPNVLNNAKAVGVHLKAKPNIFVRLGMCSLNSIMLTIYFVE